MQSFEDLGESKINKHAYLSTGSGHITCKWG